MVPFFLRASPETQLARGKLRNCSAPAPEVLRKRFSAGSAPGGRSSHSHSNPEPGRHPPGIGACPTAWVRGPPRALSDHAGGVQHCATLSGKVQMASMTWKTSMVCGVPRPSSVNCPFSGSCFLSSRGVTSQIR